MIKRLKKVGNGNALFLDRAIMEMAGLEENAKLQLTVRDGLILIAPAHPRHAEPEKFEAALGTVTRRRRAALKRLAE